MNKFRKPHGNGGRSGGGRFGDPRPGRPGFDRPNFGGAPRSHFSGPRKEGVELFDAICSKCGKACQVPFRPNGQKPVYCRACFGSPANAPAGRENFVRRDAPMTTPAPRNENRELVDLKQQLGVVNSKIDSILKTLGSIQGTIAHQAIHDAVVAAVSPKTDSPKATEKELPKKKVVKKKSAAKK
jgi:CxxC-x17-CxxC domain-containing protein